MSCVYYCIQLIFCRYASIALTLTHAWHSGNTLITSACALLFSLHDYTITQALAAEKRAKDQPRLQCHGYRLLLPNLQVSLYFYTVYCIAIAIHNAVTLLALRHCSSSSAHRI
jgi:hypothetical protein